MGLKGQFRIAGVTLSRAANAHNCWDTDRERAGTCRGSGVRALAAREKTKRKGDTDPTLGRDRHERDTPQLRGRRQYKGDVGFSQTLVWARRGPGPGSGHSPPPPSVHAREPGLGAPGLLLGYRPPPPGQRPVRLGRLRGRAARPPREAPSASSGPSGPASSSGQSAFLQKKDTTLAARRSMAWPPRLSAAA